MIKENYVYVGIDLHKETHTAVMIDCYNQKLGEITFPNRPADFPKLVTKVKKCNTDGKEVVYGLENAYGYGRALAVWLIDKGYLVKDVNTAISHRQAKHRGAMYRKSDSDDAGAIALATLNMLDKLPDACPNDTYWSLGQLVHRRDNIMKQRTRLVNQLHEQLCIAYPSYKQFFNDISRPTALYFWEHYPSRKYLKGKTVEALREELVPVSHNKCSTKTCEKILDAVASDKVKNNDFQDARDMVTLSIVSDLQHYDKQLAEVDKMLEKMYEMLAEFKPVHVVQLPNSQTEDGYELYRKELIRFKEALEEKFEVKITEEAIAKEIKKRNGINRALTRLQYTMVQDPAPVMGLDIINTVYGSGFQMNLDTLEETIDAVTDKIEKEYQEGKNVGKKPRILVTGSPSGGAALKVIRAIEENGGVVVCFENCTGMKPLAEVDEENPDVYDALSRKYLSIGCSCMSPNKARMELLEKLIKDFKVDAVVDLVLQACHTYNVETAMVKKLVKDKMGIPYTVVETDYSQADVGQIQTRMAAFIEML